MRDTTPLDLACDAAAVARLTRLLVIDELPFVRRPREAIMRRYPPHGAHLSAADGWVIRAGDTAARGWTERPDGRRITGDRLSLAGHDTLTVDGDSGSALGYLVQCPWCTGMYVAAAVALARRYAPRAWSPVARALALAYAAGALNVTV